MKVKTMKKPIKAPEIITGISGKKYAAMNFNSPEFLAAQSTFDDPPYYTKGGIETIDFIEAKQLNYNLGNVVKYILIAEHKNNTLEYLEKAQWHLSREIERVKKCLHPQ